VVGNEQRLDKVEERLINMMSAVSHLQQQVILLAKLEARSIELGDPITEMKKRICRKTRRTMVERQVED
jgi:hypothetical protein